MSYDKSSWNYAGGDRRRQAMPSPIWLRPAAHPANGAPPPPPALPEKVGLRPFAAESQLRFQLLKKHYSATRPKWSSASPAFQETNSKGLPISSLPSAKTATEESRHHHLRRRLDAPLIR